MISFFQPDHWLIAVDGLWIDFAKNKDLAALSPDNHPWATLFPLYNPFLFSIGGANIRSCKAIAWPQVRHMRVMPAAPRTHPPCFHRPCVRLAAHVIRHGVMRMPDASYMPRQCTRFTCVLMLGCIPRQRRAACRPCAHPLQDKAAYDDDAA